MLSYISLQKALIKLVFCSLKHRLTKHNDDSRYIPPPMTFPVDQFKRHDGTEHLYATKEQTMLDMRYVFRKEPPPSAILRPFAVDMLYAPVFVEIENAHCGQIYRQSNDAADYQRFGCYSPVVMTIDSP